MNNPLNDGASIAVPQIISPVNVTPPNIDFDAKRGSNCNNNIMIVGFKSKAARVH
jgi:hypothetical protein